MIPRDDRKRDAKFINFLLDEFFGKHCLANSSVTGSAKLPHVQKMDNGKLMVIKGECKSTSKLLACASESNENFRNKFQALLVFKKCETFTEHACSKGFTLLSHFLSYKKVRTLYTEKVSHKFEHSRLALEYQRH